MKKGKSTVSKSTSYESMGSFWDSKDLIDSVYKMKKVDFDVDIATQKTYCALDKSLSNKAQAAAKERGVSPDTLVNLLLSEKLNSSKLRKNSK